MQNPFFSTLTVIIIAVVALCPEKNYIQAGCDKMKIMFSHIHFANYNYSLD